MSDTIPGFRACVWNIFVKTDPKKLTDDLKRSRDRGTTAWLLCEAGGSDVTHWLEGQGLQTYLAPDQWRIAWEPKRWELQGKGSALRIEQDWFSTQGNRHINGMASAVLRDLQHQVDVRFVSYHTPPHVQVHNAPPLRVAALRELAAMWRQIADESSVVCAGGDDNVDEFKGIGSSGHYWDFMLEGATGLKQIRPPQPTEGNRRIDDFRIKGLLAPKGQAITFNNESDHDAHEREFLYDATAIIVPGLTADEREALQQLRRAGRHLAKAESVLSDKEFGDQATAIYQQLIDLRLALRQQAK